MTTRPIYEPRPHHDYAQPFDSTDVYAMTKLWPSMNRCPPGFEPKYRCTEPSDECVGVLACVAMIVGRPLADIRQAAIGLVYVPSQMHCADARPFAAELLERFGSWTGGGYDVVNPSRKLPDLAIVVTAATPGEKLGRRRHRLFHRQRPAPGQPGVEYVVDPSEIAPDQQTRFDVEAMAVTHYMHVYWRELSDDF